jgi:alkylation response protein AidB-like acyl-CoA dehydrogenase
MMSPSVLDAEARTLLCEGFRRFSQRRSERPSDTTNADEKRGTLGTSEDWRQLAEQGWLGLGLPEECGGYGPAIGDVGLLMRAAGAGSWRVPLVECLGEACGALLAAPPGVLRDRLLGEIAAGEAIVGLAEMGSDTRPATVAVSPDAGRACLTGSAPFLAAGDTWTHILVAARRTPVNDVSLYLVAACGRGVGLSCYPAVDGRSAADLELDGAAADWVADGPELLSAARRRGQLLAAAEVAGIVQAAFEATRQHLADRRQFGQPILKFQAIQHRLVDLYVCMRELTAMLDAACSAYDAQRAELDRLLWKLRAHASLTGRAVTQQSIQLHGGMGMTAEMPVGDYYKRIMLIDSLYGSHEAALDRLSETLDLHRGGQP